MAHTPDNSRRLHNFWPAPRPVAGLVFFALLASTLFAINHQILHRFWPKEHKRVTRLKITHLNPLWQGGDSWEPMAKAMAVAMLQPEGELYEEVFFRQRTKFQYAPTSLLAISPFIALYSEAWDKAALSGEFWNNLYHPLYSSLNTVSLAFLMLTLGLLVAITFHQLRAHLPEWANRPRARDAIPIGVSVGLLGLLFFPLLRCYTIGQMQAWINGLFALALWFWIRERRFYAGAALGLACLFKPQLGIFLIWAGLRRDWGLAGGFVLVFGAGSLASIACFGLGSHLDYLRVLSYISKTGEAFWPNQSVNGLMHRMLGNGKNLEWDFFSFAPPHPVVYWSTLISSIALLAGAWFWKLGRQRQATTSDFCIVALTSIMASPVAWGHHYGMAVVIMAAVLPMVLRYRPFGIWSVPAIALSYLLMALMYRWLNFLASTPLNFLQSHVFFGGLLLLALLYRLSACEGRMAGERP
jgi:hypothetical protein